MKKTKNDKKRTLFKRSLKIPKGNQNPLIEEQTTQWPEEKGEKDK
jgi:hypothetical protein